MEQTYILIYISLWLIALIYHLFKYKSIDTGVILLSSYLFYAISSYYLYTDKYYGIIYHGITLFPFVFQFALMYITAKPILAYDVKKIDRIQRPSIQIVNVFCILFIVMSLLNLPGILSKLNILSLLVSSQDLGADLYAETVTNSSYKASTMGSGISNLPSVFTNFFSRISVLFFFYHLTLSKRNKWIIIGISISIMIYILSYLLSGQRGGTFKMIVTCVITFFALRKFIPPHINKKIIKICSIGLILLCIPYYFLTASRFSSSLGGVASSIYAYTGQGNLNFNLYALDNNGLRYGDRVIPLFKKMLGFQNVPDNFWERRWKYPNLRINDESFITYVGDFVLDFGPIFSAIILFSISLFILLKTKIKNRTLMFHQLILLHFLMCVCMEGGMSLFSFADSSNMVIIVYFFMYMLFKYEYLGRKAAIDNKY